MITVPPHAIIAANVSAALAEDIGDKDWTALLIPADKSGSASVVVRQAAVVCGQPWFDEVFRQVDPAACIDWKIKEGAWVEAGTTLCEISGLARSLLTAERSALNFLQLLSAVATETRRYVDCVAGTHAQVHDTRKTIPGLRRAQKYAVLVGGGCNQRIGLYDGILIKENHIMAAGSIRAVIEKARALAPSHVTIQIEVENLTELDEALSAGATSILLDNMDHTDLREAATRASGRAVLEASGGVDLSTIRAIAETGVDRISVGKLTKDVIAVDLSMRFNL